MGPTEALGTGASPRMLGRTDPLDEGEAARPSLWVGTAPLRRAAEFRPERDDGPGDDLAVIQALGALGEGSSVGDGSPGAILRSYRSRDPRPLA